MVTARVLRPGDAVMVVNQFWSGHPSYPRGYEAGTHQVDEVFVVRFVEAPQALRDPANASAAAAGAPLQGEPSPVQRVVKFYEKGDRPLEYMASRQWFVRLMDKKDALADARSAAPADPPRDSDAGVGMPSSCSFVGF